MEEYSPHSVWEEDWNSNDEDGKHMGEEEEDEAGLLSDSSTDSTRRDKCPICLFSFGAQEVGKPESCDHKFCAICIEEWSKNVSTCPIDRKEFLKIVCLRDYHSTAVTREISVVVTNKYLDGGGGGGASDEDVTHCRICSRADREDSMLLCDGCNQGYHMECLVPALQEVPFGFWYCDDCFASNEDDDPDDELALQEEIAELLDEVREYGIPETRLRIRTEEAPRILRTRQSERIRDAILARTNRRTFREATRTEPATTTTSSTAEEDFVAMPGPSRMQTSVSFVRETTTTTRIRSGGAPSCSSSSSSRATRSRPTTRRRRVQRRTVVVEYDVAQDEDNKFAMRTKNIYKKIKQRRRKKQKETRRGVRRRGGGAACEREAGDSSHLSFDERRNQFSVSSRLELCNDSTKDGLTLTRSRAGIPSLAITGNRNTLDYFSSDDDDVGLGGYGGGGGGGGSSGGGGGLLLATRNHSFGANLMSLRSRKGRLMIPDSALPSSVDVLGSILNEQERWMTISNPRNINNIKIQPDGRLEFEGVPVPTMTAAGVAQSNVQLPSSTNNNSNSAESSSAGGGDGGGASAGSTHGAAGTSSNNGTGGGGGGGSAGGSSRANGGEGGSVAGATTYRTAAAKKALPVAAAEGKEKKEDPQSQLAKRQPQQPFEDSSDEDCPNFSLYSAETMELAKNISEPTEAAADAPANQSNPLDEEREEDLVQMDDDDDEDDVEEENKTAEEPPSATKKENELELHDEDSDWDEWNDKDDEATNRAAAEKDRQPSSVAEDAVNNQLNTESISEDEGEDEEAEDRTAPEKDDSRRSLTPCLDEKHPEADEDPEQAKSKGEDKKKIEGLELISDDDEMNVNSSGTADKPRASGEGPAAAATGEPTAEASSPEKQRAEGNAAADGFKRASKTLKERNYRDKDRRSGSPPPPAKRPPPQASRSDRERSRDRGRPSTNSHNNNSRSRRKDMVRYDVRNVIAERKQRPDKYGRDPTKQKRSRSKGAGDDDGGGSRSKSRSRSKARSRSSSLSSLSLGDSKSRSRSPRRRRAGSRSPIRNPIRRRTRASRSPVNPARRGRGSSPKNSRRKRSPSRFTMSPSLSRSPSPRGKSPRRREVRGRSRGENNNHGAERLLRRAASPGQRPFKNGRREGDLPLGKSSGNQSPLLSKKRRREEKRGRRSLSTSSRDQSPPPKEKKLPRFIDPSVAADLSKSWTPPLRRDDRPAPLLEADRDRSPVPGNFKVVVKNSGAAIATLSRRDKKAAKKKKREEKSRKEAAAAEREGKKAAKKKSKKGTSKSAAAGLPSKEVFASGDKILVSVNFSSSKKAAGAGGQPESVPPQQQTTIVTLPPSQDQIITQKKRQERQRALAEEEKQRRREQGAKGTGAGPTTKEGRTKAASGGKAKRRAGSPNGRGGALTTLVVTKNRRHRKVDAKPVAIIDLDGSPFRVLTPSPKAVIDLLSDSDAEGGRGAEKEKAREKKKNRERGGAPEGESKGGKPEAVRATSGGSGKRLEAPPLGGGGVEATSSSLNNSTSKRSSGGGGGAAAASGAPPSGLVTTITDDEDEDEGAAGDLDGYEMELIESVDLSGPAKAAHQGGANNSASLTDNGGPKTPPEPLQPKFSMAMRSKSNVIRAANPLHDAREAAEEEEAEREQATAAAATAAVPGADGGGGDLAVGVAGTGGSSSQGAAAEALEGGATTTVNLSNSEQQHNAANVSGGSSNNNNNKIGPNTPPEPAPTSPDAYDPFEPTKSNSQSPADEGGEREKLPPPPTTERTSSGGPVAKLVINSPRQRDLRSLDEHKGGKMPVSDLVMKLLNSTAGHHPQHHHHHHPMVDMTGGSLSPPPPPPPFLEKSLESSKGITILSNVVIQPGKGGDRDLASSSSKGPNPVFTMGSVTTSYSIMKQMQSEAKRMLYSKQKATPIVTTSTETKCTPTLTQAMLKKHNAECALMDMAAESPYSPGSSDYDDLFEPPMEASGSRVPSISPMKALQAGANPSSSSQPQKTHALFDSLFGSTTPPQPMGQKTWTPTKAAKKVGRSAGPLPSSSSRRPSHGRRHPHEDDVPNSAGDLLLKENYIKKLNRQERVVEEVKHVLKPHFHRKLITKEDYKEIMRKSVPKICNSRSGEINPQKIKALVDAYVAKYRYKRKYGEGGRSGGAAAAAASGAANANNSGTAAGATSSSSNIIGATTSSHSLLMGGGAASNQSKNSLSTSTAGKSMWT